jgi:hypothetical protein
MLGARQFENRQLSESSVHATLLQGIFIFSEMYQAVLPVFPTKDEADGILLRGSPLPHFPCVVYV